MAKNTWKKETIVDYTAWDLNCRDWIAPSKSSRLLEKKIKRKNRRKTKQALDKMI